MTGTDIDARNGAESGRGGVSARVTLTVTPEVAELLKGGAHVDVIVHGDAGFAALAADAAVEVRLADGTVVAASAGTDGRGAAADASSASSGSSAPTEPPVARHAIIALESTSPNAERTFREVVVALDGLPGVEITGISPLYNVTNFDAPDAFAAVLTVSATLGPRELLAATQTIESAQDDDSLDIDIVDVEGVTSDDPELTLPWPSAKEHASVLAPLLDLDPDARIGKDPVSFLLAMAPDAARVGMLSANWILGDTTSGGASSGSAFPGGGNPFGGNPFGGLA
ncbi:2-amino-4-hydroxy-6- hydroxymethyldihydropteridin e pyrophosphokinase [Bifidobacterium sp. DSM 109958]|uniref:2-amino-4-hydroxy-6-hydroxymethyldihydropteridine diphosphokinase n=1 Tax=Bifidobacterium moraviense TaxID=2675323 RepID=A0A7Y0F143_9BIFI|nr:2-amino-4-hydroxy-6-hydroxymethyldihydropteridine diphosphokinase [Bifidobacterium sp. DSM 109958]NMN00090.1 2-amino-4-hydroxy-6- hydroxymethyldihydropteridin e pyrophosphokinase [Bifidobacterium sp. DSM 109958]